MDSILEYWGAIESDFKREYDIRLLQDELSWREFSNLLSNMSADSIYYHILNKKKEEQASIVDDPLDIARDIAANMRKKR